MAGFTAIVGVLLLLLRVALSYVEAVFRLIVKPAKKNVEKDIVLVTGAGHGIGREIALAFGRLGAKLVLWDINETNNAATAQEICQSGGEAKAYLCDVSDPDAVHSVADRVRTEIGDVTILVNNAGILHGGALLDLKTRDIQRSFAVNTLSQFWTVREFLPAMLQKNSGHIVNISSLAVSGGFAYLTDYTSSKWAVFGFTESLLDEVRRLGKSGIKTSVVCPYYVDTGMTKFPIMRGSDRMLTSEETAKAAVDGVLRNEEVIFVPAHMSFVLLLTRLLTRKARRLMYVASGAGIEPQYEVKKTE